MNLSEVNAQIIDGVLTIEIPVKESVDTVISYVKALSPLSTYVGDDENKLLFDCLESIYLC